MAKFLRYALATFCFAASVGCLALWWRSYSYWDQVGGSVGGEKTLYMSALWGSGVVGLHGVEPAKIILWGLSSQEVHPKTFEHLPRPSFRSNRGNIYFPLWYPALVFALAGVAALRLGRRFTLRSALVATTFLAGLLGMAVGL